MQLESKQFILSVLLKTSASFGNVKLSLQYSEAPDVKMLVDEIVDRLGLFYGEKEREISYGRLMSTQESC